MEQHDEQHLSKQGRIVALVIAGVYAVLDCCSIYRTADRSIGSLCDFDRSAGTSRAVVGDGCNCTNLA